MINPSPLDKLLGDDTAHINLDLIAGILEKFIVINKSDGSIAFLQSFYDLDSNNKKLVIVMLASKARSLLINSIEEGLSQSDIIAMNTMPTGSVKSTLRSLSSGKHLAQNVGSKYLIPNYNIQKAVDLLNEEIKK